ASRRMSLAERSEAKALSQLARQMSLPLPCMSRCPDTSVAHLTSVRRLPATVVTAEKAKPRANCKPSLTWPAIWFTNRTQCWLFATSSDADAGPLGRERDDACCVIQRAAPSSAAFLLLGLGPRFADQQCAAVAISVVASCTASHRRGPSPIRQPLLGRVR